MCTNALSLTSAADFCSFRQSDWLAPLALEKAQFYHCTQSATSLAIPQTFEVLPLLTAQTSLSKLLCPNP